MGKGGKSKGKILFSIAGFALGGFSAGFSKFFLAKGMFSLSGAILGASLFGSIWSATHRQKLNNSSPNIQRFDKAQETMSASATIPVVYGFRKMTGNQTYHETNADQNTLHKHVVICEGGIEGIESVSANDLIIPTGNQSTHTVFTIQNTLYQDATVKKEGKHLYLYANKKTKDLYLANKDDANNVDTLWSWQTSIASLVTYINSLGDGWQAFPYATSSNYPGDLWASYIDKKYIDTVTLKWLDIPKNREFIRSSGRSFTQNGYFYELESTVTKEERYKVAMSHGMPKWRTRTVIVSMTYKRYQQKAPHNCYKNPIKMEANTVTGGTKYTFYDSVAPSNYEEVGGYPAMAWLDMNFMVSSELNGNPTVSCYVKGKKVYDTRTGKTEYSTNPAMCLRDFILSKRYGLGKWITEDNIDEDSFKEVADYCDEIIKYKGTSGEDIECKRYELNIVIDQTQSALDWITDILGNFCGFIVFSQDKLFLRIEKPEPISYKFTDSNCSDLSVAPLSLDDTPNKYEVTFVDPLNNWNSVSAVVEDYADQKARQKIISKSVSLEGTTSQNQALRLARFYRDYNAICYKTVSFKTGHQAMHLEPGDVISLSYHNVFKDEPYRITEIKENNDGTYEIAARSYNKNLYNDSLGTTIQVYSYADKPSSLAGAVPDVKEIGLRQEYYMNLDGTYVSNVIGFLDPPDYDYIKRFHVYYSVDEGDTWQYLLSTVDTSFVLTNAATGKNYRFNVVVENTSGRLSEGVYTDDYFITGKDEPPSDVSEGHVWYDPTSSKILLIWQANSEPDINHYEIFDENNKLIGSTIDTELEYKIEDSNAHAFYIYAVDNAKNRSVNALKLIAQRNVSVEEPKDLKISQEDFNLSKITLTWNHGYNTTAQVGLANIGFAKVGNTADSSQVDENLKDYLIYLDNKLIATTTEPYYEYTLSKSGRYTFSVSSRSIFNVESKKTSQTVVLKLEPEDIETFTMTQSDLDRSNLELNWGLVNHGASYEVRLGDSWESGKFIAKTSNNNFTHQIRIEGDYTFYIKAIGENGLYSLNAKKLNVELVLKPNPVTNLTAVQNPRDRSQINVSWTPPSGHDIVGYKIYINDILTDTILTNNYTYTMTQSIQLTIAVVAITVANFESNKTTINTNFFIEPMDIEQFSGTQNVAKKSELHLYWTPPSELDISHYELRMGDSWEDGTIVSKYITNNYYDITINVEKTFKFWLKAVSIAGYMSLYPATFECTFDLNPSPVTNLTIVQDSSDRSLIDISWDMVQEYDISYYIVRYGFTWEDSELIATTTTNTITFKPKEDSGNIKIMVKSVNSSGFSSDEVSANLYVSYEPSDVEDFMVYQNGDYAEFTWKKILDPDCIGYEIREGYNWDTSTVVISGITTTQYEYKLSFEGTFKYMIKAINRAGKYSVHDTIQSLKVENLSDKNVILVIDEIEEGSGEHNLTEFTTSEINWQTLGGKFNDYTTTMFSEVGGSKVLKLQKAFNHLYSDYGVYTCKVIDVGKEVIANISCKFLSTSRHNGSISANVEIRVSKDNITWSSWRNFTESQYQFRYVQIRCNLSTQNNHYSPEVNTLKLYIDVPDVLDNGTVDVPVGGITVKYNQNYYAIPSVTPYALGYGVVCQITDKTTTSFKVRVLNSETLEDLGGRINWISRGY